MVSEINLFPTCVIDAIQPDMGLATASVLERLGYTVRVTAMATCCGQPAWNSGHAGEAARVARTTLQALDDTDGPIVVPAGSCATMIRVFWQELFELHGDATDREMVKNVASRLYEFSEFVHEQPSLPATTPLDAPTVYHRSCHMLRELGIVDQPEQLLDEYAGDRRRTESQGRCCGFGGLFSVKLPEVSIAMADEVLDAMEDTGASLVVGCDASCLMQLSARATFRGMDLNFAHLAEIIDDATGDAP
jgi:L-lactate dehydrogenase complex protein LldE